MRAGFHPARGTCTQHLAHVRPGVRHGAAYSSYFWIWCIAFVLLHRRFYLSDVTGCGAQKAEPRWASSAALSFSSGLLHSHGQLCPPDPTPYCLTDMTHSNSAVLSIAEVRLTCSPAHHLPRCCRATRLRAYRYSNRFESADAPHYDEYYNGETALHEREVVVRDLRWAELSRVKEFRHETPPTFNAYLKASTSLQLWPLHSCSTVHPADQVLGFFQALVLPDVTSPDRLHPHRSW